MTLEGTAKITVGDETGELNAGDTVVTPADTSRRFINCGETTLGEIDFHARSQFIQTNSV